MFRKSFSILFAIVFLAVFDAHAYFFSATDGPNLFAFKAEVGTDGNLRITSEFKYAAPGAIGTTALLPAPGTTDIKKVFDLFATYARSGKPAVVRDRIEFDETSRTWRHVSRKIFKTHKLDNYNIVSAAVLEDLSAGSAANQRYLMTKNGTDVNTRKVSSSGKLKGKSKAAFKNPSNFRPLSAALSPDGNFAIQSFFAATTSGSQAATGASFTRGLAVHDLIEDLIVAFVVTGDIFSLSLALEIDALCAAFTELDLDTSGSETIHGSAADRAGVFYVSFDRENNLQPGKVTKIAKMAPTTLTQYQVFNTTFLLPDGKGIVFAREKSGKLEYRFQPLDGACGPKSGGSNPFLDLLNPVIANNNPIYGWAAAACAAGLYPGVC
jgi:hypothetical protein